MTGLRLFKSVMKWGICILFSLLGTSCVHQFPEEDNSGRIHLTVISLTEWLPEYDVTLSRAEDSELQLRYDFRIFPKGNTSDCIGEYTLYTSDFTRQAFTTDIDLLPGEYDIYCWSDYAYSSNGEAVYYDDKDFATITYTRPYRGDTDLRDAFRGMTSVTVKAPGMYKPEPVKSEIVLERPFARYRFIATDLEDFVEMETTRGKFASGNNPQETARRREKLANYKVRVIYPLYMPAVFNNFLDKPVDSWSGIGFICDVRQLSTEQAQLCMDYVMVNGKESSVQVALEIYDDNDILIGSTGTLVVPTQRDRTTNVYGRFLTTLRNDGVAIDPDFEGEYNIEIK